MSFLDSQVIVSAVLLVSALCYWAYKKFREPAYKPGYVAKQHGDSKGGDFYKDCSQPSPDIWSMPQAMDLYHFPVSIPSKADPHILALHGGPAIAPTQVWKLRVPNLHLFHARGCGKSTRPFRAFPTPGKMWPGMQTLEQELGVGAQVMDVERVRYLLNGSSSKAPLHLVGHSFGGFIATLYAAEFPQHVASLTLLCPASVLKLPGDGDLFALIGRKLAERGDSHHIAEFQTFLKRYLDFGNLPNETDESLAKKQADFALHYNRADTGKDGDPVDPAMIGGMACYATFLSLGMEHNYVSACRKRISAYPDIPVSIVHGAKDISPPCRDYLDLFPQASIHEIQNVGHSLYDCEEVETIVKQTIARASMK